MFSNHGFTQNNVWHFSGLPGENITALAIDTYNASVIFAGTFDGIYRNDLSPLNIFVDNRNYTAQKFKLYSKYPNPFNSITTIEYDLTIRTFIQLSIYNLLGRKRKELVSSLQASGHYKITWDSTDAFGNQVSTGINIYEPIAGDQRLVKKMFLVK